MGVVVIPRNKEIFDRDTTDELNRSFFSINDNISSYKSVPLEHKSEIRYSNNSNTFLAEKLLCIREFFKSSGVYDRFTKVAELPVSVPYDAWGNAVAENSESLLVHVTGKGVYVYGYSTPNVTFNICMDIVIP